MKDKLDYLIIELYRMSCLLWCYILSAIIPSLKHPNDKLDVEQLRLTMQIVGQDAHKMLPPEIKQRIIRLGYLIIVFVILEKVIDIFKGI